MDDGKAASLQEIDAVLKLKGFTRNWEHPLPCYEGELDPTVLRIPISVEIQDLNFVRPPVIRLRRSGEARYKPLAHVAGPEGLLCYLDTRATVLDRYKPGGTVLLCLEEAERVLRDALRGAPTKISRASFSATGRIISHWSIYPRTSRARRRSGYLISAAISTFCRCSPAPAIW